MNEDQGITLEQAAQQMLEHLQKDNPELRGARVNNIQTLGMGKWKVVLDNGNTFELTAPNMKGH